eukprot:11370796-Ditylum_brightwellii.AAC.1
MPVAEYQTRNGGNIYIASPNHPGTYDSTITANAGRVMKSRREVTHKAQLDNPLSDQQLTAKGQLHVGQMGLFKEKYLTWKRRAANLCTWNHFKSFWTKELTDYEALNKLMSREAGVGENVVVTTNNNAMSELESAMDNLAYVATT